MTLDDAYYARAEGEGTRKARQSAKSTATRGRAVQREPLARQDWILAARKALIKGGIGAVRIVPLAKSLQMTRGGFYWHFKGRQDLLDALLDDWVRTNTESFESVLKGSGHNGIAEFRALVDLWIAEKDYNPAWDTAVRNWARLSRRVGAVVKRVDEQRIEVIRQIFLDLGYQDPEALVRARITYFHQVGYYTLGLEDSRERRLELLPTYLASLTGKSLD
jgi:AcrR family transcriptional regulator